MTKQVNGKTKVKAVKAVATPDSLSKGRVTTEIVGKQIQGSNSIKYKKSIREMLGENHSPYEQTTMEEYQVFLDGLSFADLETHASSLSIPSSYEREVVEVRLLREFNLRSSDYFANAVTQPIKSKGAISPAMQRIISEGR